MDALARAGGSQTAKLLPPAAAALTTIVLGTRAIGARVALAATFSGPVAGALLGAAAYRWLRHGSPPAMEPAGIVEPELVRLEG